MIYVGFVCDKNQQTFGNAYFKVAGLAFFSEAEVVDWDFVVIASFLYAVDVLSKPSVVL